MTGVDADDKANSNSESKLQPYTPSWVDHLTARVARLPGPNWSYYLGLGLVLFLAQAVVLWVEGAFPVGRVHSAHLFLAAATPYQLAMIHYFDRRAGTALAGMRATLKATEKEYAEMNFQLTTLPAGPTLLAGLLGLGCLLWAELVAGHYRLEALDPFPISSSFLWLLYLVLWWVFGTFVYHTYHQLRLIDRIYTQYTRVNLFHTLGLYAFSNLAALTAGSLAVLPIGFMFANPAVERTDPVMLGAMLAVQLIALITFIWPQLGLHRLQVDAKERLLDEANERFEATIADLHQRIDNGQIEGIFDLSSAISGVEQERQAIERIPTWPWEPEVVRLLVTALALPLGLWIIQFVLQRVLGS